MSFATCCKKGFGLWLRSSQAEWVDNPLDAPQVEIEMTRTREKGSVFDGMKVSVLESRLKLRDVENKALKEKIKELQTRLDTLKYFYKGNSSMRKKIRKKNSNSWKTRRSKS